MNYLKWLYNGIRNIPFSEIGKIIYVFGIFFMLTTISIILLHKLFGEYGIMLSFIICLVFGVSWFMYNIEEGVLS